MLEKLNAEDRSLILFNFKTSNIILENGTIYNYIFIIIIYLLSFISFIKKYNIHHFLFVN